MWNNWSRFGDSFCNRWSPLSITPFCSKGTPSCSKGKQNQKSSYGFWRKFQCSRALFEWLFISLFILMWKFVRYFAMFLFCLNNIASLSDFKKPCFTTIIKILFDIFGLNVNNMLQFRMYRLYQVFFLCFD